MRQSQCKSVKTASLGAFLLPKAVHGIANYFARRPTSLLRPYYAGLSREGARVGWDKDPSTILPQWRWPIGVAAGPLAGVHDYEFGRMFGHQLRSSFDTKVAPRLPESQRDLSFEQLLQAAHSVRPQYQQLASGEIPSVAMSRRNRRRLRRAFSGVIADLLGATPETEFKSPLMRHLADAIRQEAPSPFVEKLRSRFSSTAQPSFQGAKGILAGAAGTAARGGILGLDLLPTLVHGAAESAVSDAPLMQIAQKRHSTPMSAKSSLVSSGMSEAYTGGLKRRAINLGLRLWDPGFGEFIDVGKDLRSIHDRVQRRYQTVHPASPQKFTQDPALSASHPSTEFKKKIEEYGSLPHLTSSVRSDVGGELSDIGREASQMGGALWGRIRSIFGKRGG